MQGPSINSLALNCPSMERRIEEGFKSFLFSPLDIRENKAALMIVSSFKSDTFTEYDLSLAQSIAIQIAGAVSNYRLHEELEHESKDREILSEIGRKATSSSDLPDVFEEIARSQNQILQCDRVSINIVNLEERRILDSFASGTETTTSQEGFTFESTLTGAVALLNAPILIQSALDGRITDDYSALSYVRGLGLLSTMAVPLRIDDKVIGALKVHSKKPFAYSSRDLYLVERIGNQIAGPIANAQSNADLERAGNAARLLQERFENILDIAEDSIISLDAQANIILFNSGAQNTFGYTVEEALGKKIDILMPERFRADHHGNIEHFKKTGDTSRVIEERPLSIYGLRKNGEEFPADASISKLADEEEAIVTVILRDTTDRLKLERKLLQSQKLEAVGTLPGGVAHDFNNMLSAILSYTHLATIDIEKGRSIAVHLEEIKKGGERSADLTKQLLGFSRQQIFNPEVTNLNSIISEVETLLARMIGENIIIETSLDPELVNVLVDRAQIGQVLMNLAVNSRDAMPNGGTMILETANKYVDNYAARLQVRRKGLPYLKARKPSYL